MRCLVTGGAGFIGSATVHALLARSDEVRVLDDLSTGLVGNVPAGVEFIRGDIRQLEAVRRACRDVEVVFHFAAVRSVPRSVDEPLLCNEVNVTGTLNVLLAAQEMGARRVVYASSSSVYGGADGRPNREDDPPRPRSPYAASKLAGEIYCRVWTTLHGLSTISLRYFNVFGPGQRTDSRYAAVFPAFCSALAAGHRPVVYGDGEQARDFTYIEDVVRANLLAADAGPNADGAVVNVGSGRPITVNEVLRSVERALGRSADPIREPQRPGDVRRTHADMGRVRTILGWEPRADWETAVAATAQWFVERRYSLDGRHG